MAEATDSLYASRFLKMPRRSRHPVSACFACAAAAFLAAAGLTPAAAPAGSPGGAGSTATERLPGPQGPAQSGTISLQARRAEKGAVWASAKVTLRVQSQFDAQLYLAPCDVGFNLAGPTPTKPIVSWSGLDLTRVQQLSPGRHTMNVEGTVSTYATVLTAGGPNPVVTNCVAAGMLDADRNELFPTRATIFLDHTTVPDPES